MFVSSPVAPLAMIVDDMSNDQFLLSFRRHCAICGTPSLILCDNAKTFPKGDEEINKLFQGLEDQAVQHHFTQKRVQMKYSLQSRHTGKACMSAWSE